MKRNFLTLKKHLRQIIAATTFAAISTGSALADGFYTNEAAFFNALASSNYTETFNSAPLGGTGFSGPTNFVGNGFTITANNTVPANGLYKDQTGGTNVFSLGGAQGTGGLIFNFSPNTYAVGGFFYVGDPAVQSATLDLLLTLSNAAPINLSTNVSSFDNAYFGWTFDNNQIISMTVSSSSVAGWASASELTVAVPEPSTYALLGLTAAGLAGYVIRRRR
jgi:hypothetical protein